MISSTVSVAPAAPAAAIRAAREAAGLGGGDETDDALARLFRQGQAAWPALALSAEAFVRHIARHTPERAAPRPHLAGLHADDLYLACACEGRVRGAIEAFQAAHGAMLDATFRGLGLQPAQRDEVRQALFEKLFVGRDGAPPKIGHYAGRGPLGGWARVAAIRTAHNALRKAKQDRRMPAEAPEGPGRGGPDPELGFLKAHYREAVQYALKEALLGLAADERNVLRLFFLDGLSVEQIASVYGVHRATVARWAARGRAALLRHTYELVARRLRLDPAEVEGVIGLVRSQLDVTLQSLFRSPASTG